MVPLRLKKSTISSATFLGRSTSSHIRSWAPKGTVGIASARTAAKAAARTIPTHAPNLPVFHRMAFTPPPDARR